MSVDVSLYSRSRSFTKSNDLVTKIFLYFLSYPLLEKRTKQVTKP